MTKAEAKSIINLVRELEKELLRFCDEETQQGIINQIKANEGLYTKAQKVLEKHN